MQLNPDVDSKIKDIQSELDALSCWIDIASLPSAQKLIAQLNKRLSDIIRLYGQIEPTNPNATTQLAVIQQKELGVRAFIDAITNANKRKKELDIELCNMLQYSQLKNNSADKDNSMIIPPKKDRT
jgi:hypothetical protein